MAEHHRAFLYILILGLPALYLARLALRSVVDERELKIWRNAWIVSTACLFLTGNMLAYAGAILALSLYVHRVSSQPANLYLALLLTAPAVGVNLGIPGVFGSIIEMSPARLLSLAFLLPTAVTIVRSAPKVPFSSADKAFVALVLLLAVLSLRHGSPTYMIRACAVILLDIALPYYVFSRSFQTAQSIRWALAALIFAALPFAMAGMFEMVRGWRLYDAAIQQWGVVLVQSYLFRDGMLRAAASAIEPISFGFVCMVAGGCLLALRERMSTRLTMIAMAAIIAGGLIAGLSRGPWLGAAILILVFAATHRRGFQTLAKVSLLGALFAVPILLSPYGDRVIRLLPFVGSVETNNEDYRAQLIDVSMAIVGRNPLFGSANYRTEPELLEMIQGQGIIDVVNTYAAVALEYGLTGLAAFGMTFMLLAVGLLRLCFRSEGDIQTLARAMLATLVAILITIGTVSSVSVIPFIYWAFAGLCMALIRVRAEASETAPSQRPRLTVVGQFSSAGASRRAGW